MKRIIGLLALLLFVAYGYSQRIVTICGDITYYVPETQSLAEAKRTAIERARLKALADKFGTHVAQTNTITIHSTNESSRTDFNSFSENEVRGIWLEDTEKPELSVSYVDDNLIINAHVCGKAREIKSTPVELVVETLNYGSSNGETNPSGPGYATTEYHHNDFFGVHFKSPVNGYVAIFMRDDNNDIVVTQLPYKNTDGYAKEVKSNRDYVFLNSNDPDFRAVNRHSTILVTDRKVEYNTLVVVFSKKPFHISLSNQGKFFAETDLKTFQKWLHSLRVYEPSVQVQEIVLTIRK